MLTFYDGYRREFTLLDKNKVNFHCFSKDYTSYSNGLMELIFVSFRSINLFFHAKIYLCDMHGAKYTYGK